MSGSNGGQADSGGASHSKPATVTGTRPTIAIPSFREVQQAERAGAVPNLFRPRDRAGPSSGPIHPGAPPPQAPLDPLTSADGAGRGMHAWGTGPGPAPAAQQQQWVAPPPQHPAQPLRHQPLQNHPAMPPIMQPRPTLNNPQQPLHHHHHQQQRQQQQQLYNNQQQGQQQQQQQPAVNPNAITVSRRQEGNPLLKHIRNVRWQYGDIVPDYLLGASTAALFLSLRYHLLKPDYIHARLKELGRAYRLRVLLVHVDTEDAVEPLAQVTRAALGNEATLLCGFSAQECARYLETLKSYEKKPAEVIQKDLGTDYVSRANSALTTVRGVNKTDVKTLGDRFGSLAAVLRASEAELQACPGIGPTKARRLFETFHEPFRRKISAQAAPDRSQAAAAPLQGAALEHQQQQQQQQQQQEEAHASAGRPEESRGLLGEGQALERADFAVELDLGAEEREDEESEGQDDFL